MVRGNIQSIEWGRTPRRFVSAGRPREVFRDGAFYQHFGFSSQPPANVRHIIIEKGAMAVSIAEDGAALGPNLEDLEATVAIWKDADNYVAIKNDGTVFVKAESAIVDSDDIKLGGLSGLRKLVDERIQNAIATHIHLFPASGGAPTTTPYTIVDGVPAPMTFGILPGQVNCLTSKTEAL